MKLNIVNGIIQDKTIDGVPVELMIAQRVTGYMMPGTRLDYKGITMHDTGNSNHGADARAHARLIASGERSGSGWQASFQFCVDSERIVQIMPVTAAAWHAGDYTGNNTTIGIEVCQNADGNRARAEHNAVQLAGSLLATLGGTLYKHQDWTGKFCPAVVLSRGGWPEYKSAIYAVRDGSAATGGGTVTNNDWPKGTYEVLPEIGLNYRTSPETGSIVGAYAQGTQIRAIASVKTSGGVWLKLDNGYFACATAHGVGYLKLIKADTPKPNPTPVKPSQGKTDYKLLARQALPVLQQGSTGDAVKVLQAILTHKSYLMDVDGHFGAVTDKLVKQYQKAVKTDQDGVVGPETWRLLLG